MIRFAIFWGFFRFSTSTCAGVATGQQTYNLLTTSTMNFMVRLASSFCTLRSLFKPTVMHSALQMGKNALKRPALFAPTMCEDRAKGST